MESSYRCFSVLHLSSYILLPLTGNESMLRHVAEGQSGNGQGSLEAVAGECGQCYSSELRPPYTLNIARYQHILRFLLENVNVFLLNLQVFRSFNDFNTEMTDIPLIR